MVVCTHDLAQRKKLIVALLNSLGVEQTEDLTAEKVNGAKSRIPVTSEAVGIPQDPKSAMTDTVQCHKCSRKFKLQRNLDKHLKEKHQIEPTEKPHVLKSANKSKKVTPDKPKSPLQQKVSTNHESMNAEFAKVDEFQLKFSTQQAFGNESVTPNRVFLDDSSSSDDDSVSPTIERKSVVSSLRKSPRKTVEVKARSASISAESMGTSNMHNGEPVTVVPRKVQSEKPSNTVRFSDVIDCEMAEETGNSVNAPGSEKVAKNVQDDRNETKATKVDSKLKNARHSELGLKEAQNQNRRSSVITTSSENDDESFVSAIGNNFETTGVQDVSSVTTIANSNASGFVMSEMSSLFKQQLDEMKQDFKSLLDEFRKEITEARTADAREKDANRRDSGTLTDFRSHGVDKATNVEEVLKKHVKVQVKMLDHLEDKSTGMNFQVDTKLVQTEVSGKDVATSCEDLSTGEKVEPESSRKKSKRPASSSGQQSIPESVERALNDSFLFESQTRNNLVSPKVSSKASPAKKPKTPKSARTSNVNVVDPAQVDEIFDLPLSQTGEPFISFLQSANPEREQEQNEIRNENVVLLSSANQPEANLPPQLDEAQKENATEEPRQNNEENNEELTDSILQWSINFEESQHQNPSKQKQQGPSSSKNDEKNSSAIAPKKRKLSPQKLNNPQNCSEHEDFSTSTQREVIFLDGETLAKKKKLQKMGKEVELYEALATPSAANFDGSEQRSGLVERNQTPFVKKSSGSCTSETTSAALLSDTSFFPKMKGDNKYCPSLVFVCSGLSPKENSTVKKLCSRLGAKFCKSFDRSVTHLIMKSVPEYADKFIFPRTIKFLEAVSMGLWIVEYQWVVKCMAKGEKVPELPFEMKGDLFCGLDHRGPAKARERALTNEKLFRGFVFFCPAESSDIPLETMEKLITNAGGLYITHREDFAEIERGKKIIIAETEDKQKFSMVITRMADECATPVVSREWFVDSLTMSELLPTDNFAQYKPLSMKS